MTICKAKPAKTRRSAPNSAKQASTYQPTDVTPEQFFEAWSRKDREALIELLIESLDAETGDPDLEDDGDGEPSLAACENHPDYYARGSQLHWTQGNSDEREGDDGADDREDVCEDEGAEHDGCEPDVDGEPSLGWTFDGALGNGDGFDREAGGSSVTEAHRQRYRPFNRYVANCDGRHVDAERGYGRGSRRLTNLSDQQRTAIAPRINWDEVRI
jgi:hypothetical protein